MLLRMRFRVDDENDQFKFPGPHPEEPGRAQRGRASRRMAACTVVRGHPSRRIARAMLLILRDASLARCSSSFETHRSRDAPHPSRRIARAMLLRMRFRVDDENDQLKFPGPHPEEPGRAQ